MNLKKFEHLGGGGGGVHQLNNNQLFNLQLFADSTLNYNKVDNPYNFYLNKPTWTKGDIKKVYNLVRYYEKIPNYSTITTLPEENANYIKEALPNVTDCNSMLYSCSKLTSIDTTGWITSKVTNMDGMFYNCKALTTLDVSNWNTSNVTSMDTMFSNCESLTTLDVSKWDTSNVIYMSNMFRYCNALTTLDVSNWDTSKVTGIDRMFYRCSSLTTIKGVIDMKSCNSHINMFFGCTKLTGVKIKNPPSGITDTSGIGGLAAGKYEIVS
nr:BspA family leucine-rich repeat surface protein [Catenibacterium mitsuokai]